MYFIVIFMLIIAIPVIIMPRHISAGNLSPYRIVVQAIVVTTAAMTLVFMTASLSGTGLYSQMQDMTALTSEELAKNPMVIEAFGLSSASEEERAAAIMQIYSIPLKQLPVCLMFLSAIVAYLEYRIFSKALAKRSNVKMLPKFREFSFPNGTAMAIMLMYLLSWLLTETETVADDTLFMNMDLLFDLVFILQGISVVLMFFYLKRAPKVLGGIVAGAMWVTSIGSLLLTILGLFDLMVGLKGRMQGSNAGKS